MVINHLTPSLLVFHPIFHKKQTLKESNIIINLNFSFWSLIYKHMYRYYIMTSYCIWHMSKGWHFTEWVLLLRSFKYIDYNTSLLLLKAGLPTGQCGKLLLWPRGVKSLESKGSGVFTPIHLHLHNLHHKFVRNVYHWSTVSTTVWCVPTSIFYCCLVEGLRIYF